MKLEQFLERGWSEYAKITPDAPRIHSLLSHRGERVINDHVALRTFGIEGLGRLELGKIFEQWGYARREDFEFPEKKLRATYWLHPDTTLPRIFISELLMDEISPELRSWVSDLGRQALARFKALSAEIFFEPAWEPVSFEDYSRHYGASEYAAWTAAFGIRVNHFTVSVNALRSFPDLGELNSFLKSSGILLTQTGGEIKGSPSQYLEQSSTQARRIPWKFAGGATHEVMSCYYEFARRYAVAGSDKLFQGFIPDSANRIFESTFESKRGS
jgi:hypothetical protein